MRLLKCYVWSTLLYGCESWTISKRMESQLEAAEMCFHGRRHGFESGGTILRAERANKFFLTLPLFGQWGGQNIA